MTTADVVAYHRNQAAACRESAAIAWAGYVAGCDDARHNHKGWLDEANNHDKMAETIELLDAV